MAIDPGCNSKISYTGDGAQQEFTYPFTTIEDTDLYVAVWDETTAEYNNVTNWTKDGGLIRFDSPPPDGEQIIIYRMTDIDPMKAIFHPGHPVKAGDLNNNFEQLQNAIEDTRCLIETLPDVEKERFWNKGDESTYSDDDWSNDDVHVASTAAIENRIEEIVTEKVEDINNEIGDAVKKDSGITTQMQKRGLWVSDDDHFAYTGALRERYDVIFLPVGTSAPQPIATEMIQPGKFMITGDNTLFAWNGNQWFQPIAGALAENGSVTNQHTRITTNTPLGHIYDGTTNTYDLLFQISSLPMIPGYVP